MRDWQSGLRPQRSDITPKGPAVRTSERRHGYTQRACILPYLSKRHSPPSSTLLVTGAALSVAPNILCLALWDRLFGGELYAPLSRVDWATLLRRTFDVNVTRCTRCERRMTMRAVVSRTRHLSTAFSTRSVAPATHPSPPDLARPRALRRAVAAPCPALDKRTHSVQRQRNVRPSPTCSPDSRPSLDRHRLLTRATLSDSIDELRKKHHKTWPRRFAPRWRRFERSPRLERCRPCAPRRSWAPVSEEARETRRQTPQA